MANTNFEGHRGGAREMLGQAPNGDFWVLQVTADGKLDVAATVAVTVDLDKDNDSVTIAGVQSGLTASTNYRVDALGQGYTNLVAGTALVGKFGIDQTTPGATNAVQVTGSLPAGANNIGDVDVLSIAAGTNLIGKFGIDQTTPGTTNGVTVVSEVPAGTQIIGNVRIDQTTPGTTNGVTIISEIPAGTQLIGSAGIDQTTPGTTNLVHMSAYDPSSASTSLQVDASGYLKTTNETQIKKSTITELWAVGSSLTTAFQPSSGIDSSDYNSLKLRVAYTKGTDPNEYLEVIVQEDYGDATFCDLDMSDTTAGNGVDTLNPHYFRLGAGLTAGGTFDREQGFTPGPIGADNIRIQVRLGGASTAVGTASIDSLLCNT